MLISVSPSAFPASCSARRLRLAALMLGFAVLAFCIMWWRWGGAAADSQAYLVEVQRDPDTAARGGA